MRDARQPKQAALTHLVSFYAGRSWEYQQGLSGAKLALLVQCRLGLSRQPFLLLAELEAADYAGR